MHQHTEELHAEHEAEMKASRGYSLSMVEKQFAMQREALERAQRAERDLFAAKLIQMAANRKMQKTNSELEEMEAKLNRHLSEQRASHVRGAERPQPTSASFARPLSAHRPLLCAAATDAQLGRGAPEGARGPEG